MAIQSLNPATEELLKTFPELSDEVIEEKLTKAEKAFQNWRKTTFAERAKLMMKVADNFRSNKETLGRLMTMEMGKPITAAIAEIEKCALTLEYYAENAEEFLKDEFVKTEFNESYVHFDPLGIVLAVMPWNFPFWQVIRFAAPALMAGNVGILKHASNVPQCSLAIEEQFRLAGFPEDVFQSLLIGSVKIEGIIKDDRVKAVTLTGSEHAGSQVASTAGREIKKTVLELGGSDPFIVLEDANLEIAADAAVDARLQNAGQSCIAAKRFIIVEKIYDKFIELYLEKWKKSVIGDPLDPKTTIGPLFAKSALDEIERQVKESVDKGAKVLVGGKRWGKKGFFYEPTILAEVKKGMPAYDEEIFGPVSAVIKVKDVDEAVRIANDSRYGLGSSLWTQDINTAKNIASKIESGCVFINSMVRSDPRLPFGGIKKSGYGRELSNYGIKEFVNIKGVAIKY